MKIMRLSEKFNISNLKRLVAALVAVMLLVCAVGCKDNGEDENPSSSAPSSSNNSSTQDATPSGDASTEDVSSGNTANNGSYANNSTVTSGEINPLNGNITLEYDYKSEAARSDADEFVPAKDPAGLNYKYVGYAEKERLKLRDEILNTPNTLDLYDVKGTVYYFSTKGDDTNDGKSPKTAKRTLPAIDSLTLEPGDAVLFERGCIWRMTENLVCQSGVTYGSYGEGSKPVFLGSPKNFAQEIWKPANKKNVWKINYMYSYPAGMFFNEGEQIGYQKLGLRDLEKNTDFYFNDETATLFLYCDKGNPSKVWKFIEASQSDIGIKITNGAENTVVDNFTVRYTGIHGVYCSYGAKYMTVTNCEVGYNGGGWAGGKPTGGNNRYGNSIESWCGGTGFTTNHNWIYQNFDTAITPQGRDGNLTGHYTDISICNNLFEYNNCDIESWEGTTDGKNLAYYTNNKYDNNIHRFTSLGWGTRSDDGGIRGIDGVHFGYFIKNQVKSISWSNNIIDCPGRRIYGVQFNDYDSYKNFTRNNNVYHIKQSLRTVNNLVERTFHWIDKDNYITSIAATTEKETKAAFAQFEPGAKVYWYK